MWEDTCACLQQNSCTEICNDIHRLIGSNYKGYKNADFCLFQKKRPCSIGNL